jgi:hypothetical protein
MIGAHRRAALGERGSVVVEYALALVLCTIGAVVALIAAGGLLLRLFLIQRALLMLPFP